ncbi:VWA domain-containing protein [Chloroflexi bacterium TSY]|nr:VWA domain-containing protein [Chloroflexi bacterium TSY]
MNIRNSVQLKAVVFWVVALAVTALFVAACAPPSEPVAPEAITITLEAGQIEIEPQEKMLLNLPQIGELIQMEGFSATYSPGDPMLPTRLYEVAVPPGIDWESLKLEVDPRGIEVLDEKFDILPAPPLRARIADEDEEIDPYLVDWGEGKDIVDGRNRKVYEQDRFYPEQQVRIVAQSQWRKWRFVQLEFTPVQYNPVQKTVRVTQAVQARLTFAREDERIHNDPLLADTLFDREASLRFENYAEAVNWYRYISAPRPAPAVEDPDFVIITTNDIETNSTQLANFVTHKTGLGHSVLVVTEDDYGGLTGQAPDGTAEKIRQWLIDNYVPLGIHYVLLIGDPDPDDPVAPVDSVGDVPMKMGWPHINSYRYLESPSDYFYADLTGNWDLDGDGLFGEGVNSTSPISPDPAIDPDTFSVRWTGKISTTVAGNHRFVVASDDGVRVTIDGTTIVDNWTSHFVTANYSSISLTPGQYDIEIEFHETTGEASVEFRWRLPGADSFAIVPSTNQMVQVGASYVAGGLDGEYFDNEDFTAPVLTRVDPIIDFYWGTGDKGLGGVDFAHEVYVGRIPVYNDDYATLDDILQKLIDYETGVPSAWRESFLMAAVELWEDQSDYHLGEALKTDFADPMGFTTYRVYEDDFGIVPAPECPTINAVDADPATPCNMLGEWANGGGYGLLVWSTHGGATSASHLMSSNDRVNLNDATPAFTFQGSCLNGYPENDNNLGYALLRQGAIATVSASRVSWNYVFDPAIDPEPSYGNNSNLTYHYMMRLFQDQPASHALYLTKARVHPDYSWMNKMDYNLYGDPSSALFRNIGGVALLFDTSGRMAWSHEGTTGVPLPEQRLSLAKEAVYPFMELLNDHANTRMNFGISVFPPHPWGPATPCDGQLVTPMTQVDDTTTDDAVTVTIPNLVAEGNTPLLAGLQTALGMFGDETPRALVLLSDGYHNCPGTVNSTDPEVTNVINQLNAADVRVYTIGFGRPTDIDHPLLERLASDTGGEFYDVTTPAFDPTTWSPATDLQATYKAILADALGLETAADPMEVIQAGERAKHQVHISQYDRTVSFFVSWETAQLERLGMRVFSADGEEVPFDDIIAGIAVHQGNTYKILTVDRNFLRREGKVGPDPWTLEIDSGTLDQGERENYQYSVILDSALTMEPTYDRETYWVGDTMLLTAKLAVGTQPIAGLENVYVQITRPEVGIGNWFATHQVSPIQLREVPFRIGDEVLSPLVRKARYLTDIRQIEFPGRTRPDRLPLFDDGSHGDAVANDGIYTNRFTDTKTEGTYAFQFRVAGPIGTSAFERDQVIHKYLTPKVQAPQIEVTIQELAAPSNNLRRFEATVTPKDAFNNYMGPRYPIDIDLGMQQLPRFGELRDNLDGSYTVIFELPQRVDLGQVDLQIRAQDVRLSMNVERLLR